MASEKRLIDANEFVKNFWQRVYDGEIVTLMDVEHAIINTTTVDAVEVVRCKDCDYCGYFGGLLYCDNSRGPAGSILPDGYCYLGERRTDVHT